jgi:hypothetical protein
MSHITHPNERLDKIIVYAGHKEPTVTAVSFVVSDVFLFWKFFLTKSVSKFMDCSKET